MNELFLKEFDSEEDDEEYMPDKKELESTQEPEEVKKEVNKSKIEEMWNKMKSKNKTEDTKLNPNASNTNNQVKTETTLEPSINTPPTLITEEKEKIINKKLSIEEEIQNAIKKSKEMKSSIAKETVHFAGQTFEYQKVITEEDLKKIKDKEKKKTHSGLDSIVEQIEKKSNINTYTKSKKDWNNYVEEKQIQKELDYNRKDGFLQKKIFIEETNAKLMENKKSVKRQKKEN